MTEINIHETATALEDDTGLADKSQQFNRELGNKDTDFNRWNNLRVMGTGVNGYDMISKQLESWISREGKRKATAEKLFVILNRLECGSAAEILEEKFGPFSTLDLTSVQAQERQTVNADLPVAHVQPRQILSDSQPNSNATNASALSASGSGPTSTVGNGGQTRTTDEHDHYDFVVNETPLKVQIVPGVKFMDGPEDYKTRSTPRGHGLILSNIKFLQNKTREGADKDENYMRDLLGGLQYTVDLQTDVYSTDLSDVIENFKKKCIRRPVDSLIVVIMSHGRRDEIEMSDSKCVHLWEDIVYKFDSKNCPDLADIPKIFIVQACQPFVRVDHDDAGFPTLPISNTIVCLSTIPGKPSNRDLCLGTWYIYCLTDVIMKHAHNTDLLTMLEMVAKSMTRIKTHEADGQLSTWKQLGFYKKFYFNPGLKE